MKIFNWLIIGVFAGFAVVVSIHYIRVSQRTIVKRPEVTVTIPEGFTIYDIDRVLGSNGVIQPGSLIAAALAPSSTPVEGRLFPDTYNFFLSVSATSAIQKFLDNFNTKAGPLLAADPDNAEH